MSVVCVLGVNEGGVDGQCMLSESRESVELVIRGICAVVNH